MSRAYTAEEVRDMVLQHLRTMAVYWAEQPGLSPHDRTDGMAFSMLTMLDGVAAMPAMELVVRTTEEDKAYQIEEGENFYEDGTMVNADLMLHDHYYADQDRH